MKFLISETGDDYSGEPMTKFCIFPCIAYSDSLNQKKYIVWFERVFWNDTYNSWILYN